MTTDSILQNILKHIDLDQGETDYFFSLLQCKKVPKKNLLLGWDKDLPVPFERDEVPDAFKENSSRHIMDHRLPGLLRYLPTISSMESCLKNIRLKRD